MDRLLPFRRYFHINLVAVLVGADGSGVFRAPPVVPNWESYAGVMDWYVEE